MKAITNAGSVALKYAKRSLVLDAALSTGLGRAAAKVDNQQVRNLSGSGSDAPGSYPVPVRKGTLRGGHGWAVKMGNASVFNTTAYAMTIHRDRPFLDDAAESVDVVDVVGDAVFKGFAV